MDDTDRHGKVVTFYSYKGGTGRTMALANVAWILASTGKRVLVVDWDLEAPGLQRFYEPFVDAAILDASDGIADIISSCARAGRQHAGRNKEWHLPFAQIVPHAVSLGWDFPGEGTLDLISAGSQERVHVDLLSGFPWDTFLHRLGGTELFAAMRADMCRNYDYTLIDSRTGLSDIANICTVRLPDTVVNCFTLTNQSVDGAAAVARSIGELQDRDIRVLPVPMRVEDAEQIKLENGRAWARAKFSGYPRGWSAEARQRYWGDVEIPYKPFYAYEETLAIFGDEPYISTSLLSAYERLAAVISDGEVRELPPIEPRVRQRYLADFERNRPKDAADVFLSYAPEDRVWADWIGQVLSGAGVHVATHGTGLTPGTNLNMETGKAVSAAARTVVVLSSAYVRSARAGALWESMAASEVGRKRSTMIPIRVSDVRLEAPFDAWSTVDLAGLDEHAAIEAILRGLDLPLPSDTLSAELASAARFPGTPPPVWNVPTRNASFTGRGVLLERLRDNLQTGMAVVMPQALHGLGGVGKTQLALEFAHRFRADYDLVWWISAQQEEFITTAMAEIAPEIGVRRGENPDETADAVREALRMGRPYKRWLLVFDNAEDPERLIRHLPQGTGHVVITSRNPNWATRAEAVEVDPFSRPESVEHIMNRVQGIDSVAAAEVAGLLGDLPLAVELASAWLASTGMPVDQYVSLLQNQLAQWLEETQTPDYPLTAAATWRLSIDRLAEKSPAAVRLLELCSCFSPEPISLRLLYSDEMIRYLVAIDPALQEKMLLGQVIREIGRYALAKVDQGRSSIQVHRLVQAVIRDSMGHRRFVETQHDVHRILVNGRPAQGDVNDPDLLPRYRDIWAHLGPSEADQCIEEPVRALLVERVRFLWVNGEYEEGLTVGHRLEESWTRTRGPNDRQLLYLRSQLGNIHRSQGDYATALRIDSEVLDRQTREFGPDYVHTLITSRGLVADLGATGSISRALEVARDTHARFVNGFDEDHPLTLMAASTLSLAYRLNGDCFSARDVDARTLEFRRQVLGDDHPRTLTSMANLARDMREAGNYRESTSLLRTALERYRDRLESDVPEVLRTATSLAVSLRMQGEHEEAKQLSEQTLALYHQSFRRDYPDALACMLNLACDHSALDDAERALELAEEVEAAYVASRGPEHQYALVCANNRSIYLRALTRTDEALALGRTTLSTLRKTFGPAHPHTLAAAINLANSLADSGQLEQAEQLERATHEGYLQLLGPTHPDTLFSAGNLAITLRSLNRLEEAQRLMASSLIELERVLGTDHPHIEWGRKWRRISRDLEPQPV